MVHRGSGCKVRVTLSKGEMTRDAVKWCQGTAAGRGRPTRAWMRRERQGDGSAAGGHVNFFWDTYPAILVPSLAATSCRKHTGAGLHEHPMRDLAKLEPREKAGAFPQEFSRGDGSRDRASGEAGMVGCGAPRRERCSRKKRGWPPAGLPSVCRSRHPQGSPVRPAPADVQETVSRMVNPPPLPALCGVQLNPR